VENEAANICKNTTYGRAIYSQFTAHTYKFPNKQAQYETQSSDITYE